MYEFTNKIKLLYIARLNYIYGTNAIFCSANVTYSDEVQRYLLLADFFIKLERSY